ncbi:four-helix bundle copper-binding protein [Burkholderia diffusa]|uniref:four-helix bundle copper-binding protein n=1 Tax=Burkholderia diffusa TaxID=488732 RepID=UPI002652478B|nr:four-helix bundle copper-binding protein [Burkholderia diffusa]MDN7907822.1 four-helix bundle copper-binding protein [Burkholderia diffusa]
MDRRDALFGTGLLALSAFATMERASAQESAPAESPHMHHGGHGSALADAAGDCMSKGQVCVSHCIGLLGKGNKDLAACATSASQMLSLCTALQQLANQNSHYLPALAKVALDACNDCEAECKKHADSHEPCKACMESCRTCANACRAVLAT